MGKAHSLAMSVAGIAAELGVSIEKEVLVDVTPDVAAAAASRLGWNSSSDSWRQTLRREDIDVVDICTPPHMHKEIATAAISSGKHVFCEKPITNSSAEAQAMVDAADRAGVTTQVGFNYRHTPAIAFTKKLIEDGRLGVPLQFRASFLQAANFNADPKRWRASKLTGGSGTVGDVGSHLVDIAEYLFGDIARVAARVRAKAPVAEDGWVDERERVEQDLVDNAGVWLAEFENGAIGNFAVNSYSSGRQNRLYFELDTSQGAVEFDWNAREEFRVSYVAEPDDHKGFRTIHTNSQHPNGWWRLAGLGTGYVEIMAIEFQEFFRAIASGTQAEPNFATGLRVQTVIEAVNAAAATGQWVDVPPRVRKER